jgi:hypothetical protein
MTHRTYIVDFLNIFSDFREIKYKKQNIDFHYVKHDNKLKDTLDFFDLFFTKYIDFVKINRNGNFIFIMKKLNDHVDTLGHVLKKYHNYNVKFMIIEDQYQDLTLDKNKDDFLCQYIFYVMSKSTNCTLISNDKYRDKKEYIGSFIYDMTICTLEWNKIIQSVQKSVIKYKVNPNIRNNLRTQTCLRCTIPKRKLNIII